MGDCLFQGKLEMWQFRRVKNVVLCRLVLLTLVLSQKHWTKTMHWCENRPCYRIVLQLRQPVFPLFLVFGGDGQLACSRGSFTCRRYSSTGWGKVLRRSTFKFVYLFGASSLFRTLLGRIFCAVGDWSTLTNQRRDPERPTAALVVEHSTITTPSGALGPCCCRSRINRATPVAAYAPVFLP